MFRFERATICTVHTPGHSHDHMCFIFEEEQAMFTGDAVLGHGTAAVEHLRTWIDTLHTMRSHNCVKGYPAHGIIIEDLPAKLSIEPAQKVKRERQVLQKLEATRRARQG